MVKSLQAWIRPLPGLLLLISIAVFARGGADFGFPRWTGADAWLRSLPVLIGGKNLFVDVLHLNFILITILIGMLIRNTLGTPRWAADGVKLSRLFIKIGVILLGSLYSFKDLFFLGLTSSVLLLFFILVTIRFVMWLGKKLNLDPATASVLAAGCSICGVSAIVAAAPSVKARTADVAYSIATILAFGVACLFFFPLLGTWFGLTPGQFGVWVGTGLLNSGQVLAASLAFEPGSAAAPSGSLKTGEIFNLTRVVLLPFVVYLLVYAYARVSGKTVNPGEGICRDASRKFPIFVLGFLAMVVLSSAGVFGASDPLSERMHWIRNLYMWFFLIGLAGLGMQISIGEMRKAGGAPLLIGVSAGLVKAVGALIIVKLFIAP
ncbi:MAG: putative sulfate exporter family transporter [Firmicutes bacterium]|nr:putative sulfate exporter family transporter [Bacillota bacterium]